MSSPCAGSWNRCWGARWTSSRRTPSGTPSAAARFSALIRWSMQPEERDAAYLWDMLQASRDILEFTRGVSLSDFSSNKMLQMAVERGFQVLGEAARRVTESFKAAHPEIPWS